jgi:hypothetical protein
MANTVIALKKSATPSSVPVDLANGELAINYADGKLYYKAANGTIAVISGNEPNYFGTVNANNTLVVADTPGDIFTIAAGKNIDIVGDAVNDKLTVRLTDDVTVPGLLTVSAASGDEGGEIRLANAVTSSVLAGPVNIDIYQNKLRFFVGAGDARGAFINLAATAAGVGTDLLASSGSTDTYARATAGQAFDKANAALPNISGTWFDGTLTASSNLVADKIIATNNGNGENFKVGDDVWLGDYNVSNSMRIKGQQNASIAYINFGIDDTKALGRAGTGPLTYDGNTVWHAGNDGTGSGLDADLLDGQHGSYYGIATDVTAAIAVANAAFLHANAAFATSNANYAFSNSAHSIANLAFTHANNAYAKANTANITADLAFTHANNAYAKANAANVTADNALPKSGGTITGNLAITGSLTVSGNAYTIDSQNLIVSDPLIYLAGNNYVSDIVDIGFVANYVNATGSNVHTGFFRDATIKEYYLFDSYDKEPIPNHIDTAGNNFTISVLNATIKTSNLILGGTNTIPWITASFNHANAAHASANSGMAIANGAFASANAGQATANASYAFSNSAHSIANLAFTHANNAYIQANAALANVTTRATYSGNLDFTAGGISFGSRVSSASTNVMNHIALWGTSFGFSITEQNLNAVVPATANVTILVGSTQRARVNSTGMWVEGGVNATSMIKSTSLFINNTDVEAAYGAAFNKANNASFDSGTRLAFQQTAAPTGWTKDLTHNNKALRIINGTVGTGGTVAFTTAFASQSVSGTVGNQTATGTVGNQTATGNISTETIANMVANTASADGNISNTTATGNISNTAADGTVGGTTLTTANMPSHRHQVYGSTTTTSSTAVGSRATSAQAFMATNAATGLQYHTNFPASVTQALDVTGGDGSHTHTFTGTAHTHNFTGTAHTHNFTPTAHVHTITDNVGHNHTFTGTAHTHTFTGTAHTHTFTGTAIDLDVQYVDFIIASKD